MDDIKVFSIEELEKMYPTIDTERLFTALVVDAIILTVSFIIWGI